MNRDQQGYLSAGALPLAGRRDELSVLGGLIDAVREGESRVLVVRGEPGVGKTTLLEHLAGQERGCQVARASGVQSEMELAFAGLHQLCAPMLGRAERLPLPQQDALRTAFGLVAGPPPDRFIVGLAALNLLSEVAAERPLICLIDDEQWLDQASAQALGFTARRLGADPVGLVFATRDPGAELAGLPELEVAGLPEQDARTLLDSALAGPLDTQVRDLIVAETRGNPLALLELPEALSPAELAGGFGLPQAATLTGQVGHAFTRQLAALPPRPGGWCCWPRPIRPVTGRWSGGRPGGWGSPLQAARASRGGGPGRVRRPGQVPAPAGALGRLSVRLAARAAGGARGPGGGDRPGRGPRSPGVASGPGGGRPRRGGRGRAGVLGRAGAGPRRPGGGGRVPGAVGGADRRSGPAGRPRARRGAGQPAGRRLRQRPRPARGGRGGTARRIRPRPGGPAARPGRLRLRSHPRRGRRAA